MAFNEFVYAIDNAEPAQETPVEEQVVTEQEPSTEGSGAESSESSPSKDPNELIRALEADRDSANQRASQADFVNRLLMERNERNQPQAETPSDIQEILNKMGADDFVTASEVKRLQDYHAGMLREDYEQKIIDMQEETVRSKHDDYDDVLNYLVLPAVKENPKLWDIFKQSKNPAQAAYDYGIMQPLYKEYLKSQEAKTAQAKTNKVVDKISKNLSRPATLGSISSKGQTESDKVREILDASPEDFEKMIAEAKNR